MCGPLCACFTSCLHGNTQLDACCFCIPLRVGALIFAALYVIIDIVLVVMFSVRYHEDPFETFVRDNATTSDNILEEIRRRMLTAVHGVHPCILILIIFFAVWLVLDTVLIVSAALEWPVVIRIWGCLSMFRWLHVFIDIFLTVITTILVKDADAYLIPNYIALAALRIDCPQTHEQRLAKTRFQRLPTERTREPVPAAGDDSETRDPLAGEEE